MNKLSGYLGTSPHALHIRVNVEHCTYIHFVSEIPASSCECTAFQLKKWNHQNLMLSKIQYRPERRISRTSHFPNTNSRTISSVWENEWQGIWNKLFLTTRMEILLPVSNFIATRKGTNYQLFYSLIYHHYAIFYFIASK